MLEYIPQLAEAGITSIKIEGRMKSVFYVATVVSAYRKALDEYFKAPASYEYNPAWMTELMKASHREFTTGFYFDKPTNEDQNYQTSSYIRDYSFIGIVKSYDPETSMAIVEQRNKMVLGDTIEVFGPRKDFFQQKLTVLLNEEGEPIESAPHPQQILQIKMEQPVDVNYILRKEK
jgi:putative protease